MKWTKLLTDLCEVFGVKVKIDTFEKDSGDDLKERLELLIVSHGTNNIKVNNLYYINSLQNSNYFYYAFEKESTLCYALIGPWNEIDESSETSKIPYINDSLLWERLILMTFDYHNPTTSIVLITNKNELTLVEDKQYANESNKNLINEQYELEHQLLNSISRGDTRESVIVFKKMTSKNNDLSNILKSDPISTFHKLNTLCRKAAETSSVAPYRLHELSDYFSRKISNLTKSEIYPNFAKNIVYSYCELVRENSTMNLSLTIQNAVNLINLNSSEEVTLKYLAKKLNVNTSYLSSRFHQETGATITEFITKKRLTYASNLLRISNLSITQIANQCGYLDANYFSRVFKANFSISPTAYRKLESFSLR